MVFGIWWLMELGWWLVCMSWWFQLECSLFSDCDLFRSHHSPRLLEPKSMRISLPIFGMKISMVFPLSIGTVLFNYLISFSPDSILFSILALTLTINLKRSSDTNCYELILYLLDIIKMHEICVDWIEYFIEWIAIKIKNLLCLALHQKIISSASPFEIQCYVEIRSLKSCLNLLTLYYFY